MRGHSGAGKHDRMSCTTGRTGQEKSSTMGKKSSAKTPSQNPPPPATPPEQTKGPGPLVLGAVFVAIVGIGALAFWRPPNSAGQAVSASASSPAAAATSSPAAAATSSPEQRAA